MTDQNIEELKQKFLDIAAENFDEEFKFYEKHAQEANEWLRGHAPIYVNRCVSYLAKRCMHTLRLLKAQKEFMKAIQNETSSNSLDNP